MSKPLAIFIRHPESTGNAEGLTKGSKNYPLDAKGKREAKSVALRVARFKPSIVVSSPLDRAREAADEIGHASGAPVKVDQGLLPQDFGELTGTPRSEGEPAVRRYAMETPSKKIPGGESFNGWLGKADSAIRRVKALIAEGERPAVVTHSRNLRELSHSLFGSKPADPTKGGPEPSGLATLSRSMKLKIHAPVGARS